MKLSVEQFKCRICGNIADGAYLPGKDPIDCYCAYVIEGANPKHIAACTVRPEDHVGIADLVGWRKG